MQTSTNTLVPCLWLDDQAEAAARFYIETFPDGRITGMSRYPQSIDNPSHRPRGSVLTVEFEIAGRRFTALNGGPLFQINPSISFFVHTKSAAETERLASTLAEGGSVMMPVGSYPWSERYGWVVDRFGVSWQVITASEWPEGATIVPCLMFADAQHGRAEEAIQHYTRIFPNSRTEELVRYTAERGPEGKIVHGRFWLSGQPMIAMDSHEARGATFNEGLSFQVMCEDQATVDRYWAELSAGGKPGPCGWLTDRFGLSWQVVPTSITQWMTSSNSAARDRAFEVMLGMGKLDIAKLHAAFQSA